MKTLKPQRLGLFCRPYEDGRDCHLAVSILAFFPFSGPGPLLTEMELWKFLPAELGRNVALDAGMPKPGGELLLGAKAFRPATSRHPGCQVRVRLGSIDKALLVFGERRWTLDGGRTDPVPFTEMPITWENAYGGPDYPWNPLGKGHAPVTTPAGTFHPLPNLEHPDRPVRSPRDQVPPAGFGPYDITWPQRAERAGTYDERWLKERYPGFPADLDGSYFNTAPEDQRIQGFFCGDERFVLENLHPRLPVLSGTLPGIAARCFINQKQAGGEAFLEVPTRLETVWLFPHAERGVLIFRGTVPVAEDDAADVLQILIGAEDLGAPRPIDHYRGVFDSRMDRKNGAVHLLRDEDLLPPVRPGEGAPATGLEEMQALIAHEGLLRKNLRRKAEREREQTRQQLSALGLDPDQAGIPPLPEDDPLEGISDPGVLIQKAESLVAEHTAKLETMKQEAEAQVRQICADHGIDFDRMMAEGSPGQGGPVRFSADEELAKLRAIADDLRKSGQPDAGLEAFVRDPALETRLRSAEQQLLQAYVANAHHFPPAGPMPPEQRERIREAVTARHHQGLGLAGADLTGADLSNLPLEGADLRGALLEGADLSGTTLSGADLSGAVLARANLTRTDLTGARLVKANLGGARLHATRLEGADLTEAVLSQADLAQTSLKGALLERADVTEASFQRVDFRDAKAGGLIFLKSDLTGAKFNGATLTKCTFLEVTLEQADFTGSDLTAAVLVTVKGARAVFRGANLTNLRVVERCALPGADFSNACLERANLRGADLSGANFTGAALSGADLSECRLMGANLYRVVAREALLVRTDLRAARLAAANLMLAILQKADLCGTNLLGANLFRADLARARMDRTTVLTDANLEEARLVAIRGPNGT